MKERTDKTLTCEDGVSDVTNVGFSEDTPKPPADHSNSTNGMVLK
ncbi:MAG TPA: hypothetical protein VEH06_03535 [Candidatus Bathyarchaeia archaeon]|nr:hypothetical protein [Candidatus Bathyarchaeia archaeon]